MQHVMLFVPTMSMKFYLLYIIAGFTDIDYGTAARMLKRRSSV